MCSSLGAMLVLAKRSSSVSLPKSAYMVAETDPGSAMKHATNGSSRIMNAPLLEMNT